MTESLVETVTSLYTATPHLQLKFLFMHCSISMNITYCPVKILFRKPLFHNYFVEIHPRLGVAPKWGGGDFIRRKTSEVSHVCTIS